jgi:hypothetical protein
MAPDGPTPAGHRTAACHLPVGDQPVAHRCAGRLPPPECRTGNHRAAPDRRSTPPDPFRRRDVPAVDHRGCGDAHRPRPLPDEGGHDQIHGHHPGPPAGSSTPRSASRRRPTVAGGHPTTSVPQTRRRSTDLRPAGAARHRPSFPTSCSRAHADVPSGRTDGQVRRSGHEPRCRPTADRTSIPPLPTGPSRFHRFPRGRFPIPIPRFVRPRLGRHRFDRYRVAQSRVVRPRVGRYRFGRPLSDWHRFGRYRFGRPLSDWHRFGRPRISPYFPSTGRRMDDRPERSTFALRNHSLRPSGATAPCRHLSPNAISALVRSLSNPPVCVRFHWGSIVQGSPMECRPTT